ncbi:DUF4406 domain-containing protein [Metapseudomonas otitidis]|uniref:Nucleoside 2-deoxyribosyltransferase n=1 Tax=Metapseudomonas otitidis TaxID=319939 RepID=A0A679GBW0_9GAMM|nr:DUF4406 domain-containing protein [Pseudomonas otitidis]BCA28331.1 hypothetical protein PtoMrB4_23080 [Pseudomonas otitidis]
MRRIYLAGPMTGLPQLNFPAFHAEAARLRALGYDVVNPAELNPNPNTSWQTCMRVDIRELVTCDAVAMLPGWTSSHGATLEHACAVQCGMEVVLASNILSPRQELGAERAEVCHA